MIALQQIFIARFAFDRPLIGEDHCAECELPSGQGGRCDRDEGAAAIERVAT